MSDPQYNPTSLDAVVSRIEGRLDQQDKSFQNKREEDRFAFQAVLAKQDYTNGKVTQLRADVTDLQTEAKVNKAKLYAIVTTITVILQFIGWAIASNYVSVHTVVTSK